MVDFLPSWVFMSARRRSGFGIGAEGGGGGSAWRYCVAAVMADEDSLLAFLNMSAPEPKAFDLDIVAVMAP